RAARVVVRDRADAASEAARARLAARAAGARAPDGRPLRDPGRGAPLLRRRRHVRLRGACADAADARVPGRALPRVDLDGADVLEPLVRPQAAEVAAPADDADAHRLG